MKHPAESYGFSRPRQPFWSKSWWYVTYQRRWSRTMAGFSSGSAHEEQNCATAVLRTTSSVGKTVWRLGAWRYTTSRSALKEQAWKLYRTLAGKQQHLKRTADLDATDIRKKNSIWRMVHEERKNHSNSPRKKRRNWMRMRWHTSRRWRLIKRHWNKQRLKQLRKDQWVEVVWKNPERNDIGLFILHKVQNKDLPVLQRPCTELVYPVIV